MSETHSNYLRDLGNLLREAAVDARRRHQEAAGSENESFEAGRSMAYYEVVSLLIDQAVAFEIPTEVLGLSGFDPDRDLLSGTSTQ